MTDQVWIVGQVTMGTDYGQIWDFQGVFATEADAIAACRNSCYFVGPAIIGQTYPDETMDEWPGAYFPSEISFT